jgi:hypothetical protein
VIGIIAAWLAAVAFIAIGLGALVAPGLSSRQYGLAIVETHALGFVRALGIRDLGIGLIVAALLLGGMREALVWTLGLSALVGAGDFAIVVSARGANQRALWIHGGGTVALLAAAALVARGMR